MKKYFLISIMCCIHIAEIVAQDIPSIKGYSWGMQYENVLKKLQVKKIEYTECSEKEISIVCSDYHLLMSQIGLSEGYDTVFRFNESNELFCILILMRKDKFDTLQKQNIVKNVTDFVTMTNAEWLFLRKKYGEETFKNLPDVSKDNFDQKIFWIFDDGAIELRRAWYGTYKKCEDYNFYVAIQCETYVD